MNTPAAVVDLARVIGSVRQIVVFTGAGISTESGIPDFRSPRGIWSKYQPLTIQEFVASESARRRYWQYKREAWPELAAALPNAGHRAIAQLERLRKLQALITQNIDGLHERAGNSRELILELHGTERWVLCLNCDARHDRAEIQQWLEAGDCVPRCRACNGLLKPATISFGQALPEDVLREAYAHAQQCEAFLVVGSSLVVHPAAGLPQVAKQSGAWLGILNREATPLDAVADWQSADSAGEILRAAVEQLASC